MRRSRRKLDTSAIDFNDSLNSPAMHGMEGLVGLLRSGGVPLSPAPLTGIQDANAPATSKSDPTAAQRRDGAPPNRPPLSGVAVSGVPLSTPDAESANTASRGVDKYFKRPESTPVVNGVPLSSGPLSGSALSGGALSATPPYSTPLSAPRIASDELESFSARSRRNGQTEAPSESTRVLQPNPQHFGNIPLAQKLGLNRSKPYRAKLAQDGHTYGEQALYEALWQNGDPYKEGSKIITAGYRTIAQVCRLSVNMIKANLKALTEKLAIIEIGGFSNTSGRTYVVYDYKTILERRNQAGMTHCTKSRGVTFVHPETGKPITSRVVDLRSGKAGRPESGVPLSSEGLDSTQSGTPESDESGVPDSVKNGAPLSSPFPIEITKRNNSRKSTATDDLRQLLERTTPAIDQRAINRIWQETRDIVPDSTPKEVATQFENRASVVYQNRRIENPMGIMLSTISDWFVPDRVYAQRKQEEMDTAEMEEILARIEAEKARRS